MIRFPCPHCGSSLSAPEECVGRLSRCKCGQPVTVPPAPAVAAVSLVTPLAEPPAPMIAIQPQPFVRAVHFQGGPAATGFPDAPQPPRGRIGLLVLLVCLPGLLFAVVLFCLLTSSNSPEQRVAEGPDNKGTPQNYSLPQSNSPPPVDRPAVVEGEVDPEPRLKVAFDEGAADVPGFPAGRTMRFGILARVPQAPWKQLTYSTRGLTNSTLVKIDGQTFAYGTAGGQWMADGQGGDLRTVRYPNKWSDKTGGVRSVWGFEPQGVEVTQLVEVIPGAPSESAGFRRLLDTCLVRYRIENKDSKAHTVGLRFLLDTLIGSNDGVPFTVPGLPGLVDDCRDFNPPGSAIPAFIEVLENPDLRNPGVIALLNPRVGGGLEAPDRLSLTAWSFLTLPVWDVPVRPMGHDSAVILYWNERDLKPGEKREVGFTYGLGNLAVGGGQLGVTVGGDFRPGGELSVVALVGAAQGGEKLTLKLPDGFRLAPGQHAVQEVPPLGVLNLPRPVTWRVQAGERAGDFDLEVQSSTGVSQKKRVNVKAGSGF